MGVHGRRRRGRPSTATATAFRSCCWPAASSRRSSIATPARRAAPLKFAAEQSGLELDKVSGAYPLDVDSDGITDLVLLRVGENVAMRGLGGCKFERANEAWGFDGGDAWWTSLAATWEKGADWPTIAVGSYIDRKEEISPWGSCTDNWLLRPAAGEQKFGAPVPLKPSFCPLSMLFTDWNRSGTPSLRVSNDREYYEGGQEQMWKIEPGKEPALYTAAEGWQLSAHLGHGHRQLRPELRRLSGIFPDLDGRQQAADAGGRPDRRSARRSRHYADVAWPKGVTAHRPYMGEDLKPSTAWHTQFEDVNNDGLVDLFIAKGNVWDMPDFAMKDPNNLLLQQADGKFKEAGDKAGVASVEQARGAALADFNLDGLVDLVVVNRNSPAQIWRNTSRNAGHWIEVKLEQPARTATRSAHGSRCAAKARRSCAARSRSAAAMPAARRLVAFRPRQDRRRPRFASSGRTARAATGSRSTPTVSTS